MLVVGQPLDSFFLFLASLPLVVGALFCDAADSGPRAPQVGSRGIGGLISDPKYRSFSPRTRRIPESPSTELSLV
jgi:hypothetical protein